jgi:hypothetical protein
MTPSGTWILAEWAKVAQVVDRFARRTDKKSGGKARLLRRERSRKTVRVS